MLGKVTGLDKTLSMTCIPCDVLASPILHSGLQIIDSQL